MEASRFRAGSILAYFIFPFPALRQKVLRTGPDQSTAIVEVEAEGLQVQNLSGLQDEFKARLDNFSGPSIKTAKGLGDRALFGTHQALGSTLS